MLQAGMWFISDLYKNGNIIRFSEWPNRGVPINCYMAWRSIIEVLRFKGQNVYERDPLLKGSIYVLDINKKLKELCKLKTRQVYNILVNRKYITPAVIYKHKMIAVHDNDEIDKWQYIFSLPHIACKENDLKKIQFRILHRCLSTNVLLLKMKKVDSARCTFCFLYIETIEHLFFE